MRRLLPLLIMLWSGLALAQPVFTVAVAQGGVEQPIKDHTVSLKRAPFELVIYFQEPGESVLVNVAQNADTFAVDATVKGQGPDVAYKGQTGMAEALFNPAFELLLSEAPHYLYFKDEGDHRFNEIKRLPDGRVRCARVVRNLNAKGVAKPIGHLKDLRALHLSMFSTQWKPDYSGQIVRQREWLTLLFR